MGLTIKNHNSPFGYCSSLKTPFLKVLKGGFSLSRNFHVCTHVNNIEVIQGPHICSKLDIKLKGSSNIESFKQNIIGKKT